MRSPLRGRAARALASAALVFAALLPGAVAPVAAADPVVLTVGTTQDLDTTNPYSTVQVSGFEVFALTYSLLTDFGQNAEPVPGYADTWERTPTNVKFHIRSGMKWSDGQPASAQDACFSWQLSLDAIKAGTDVGLGYISPNVKDAGVTKVECPDDSTMIVSTTDQSDRVFQTYVPILPKHVWSKETYKTIGDAKFTGPLVGSGPYTLAEWKTSQFARFVRNPNYWGKQGFEDEVVIRFYKSADAMVQALKAGEVDYIRDPNADQLKALQNEPNVKTVAGKANGWTQLAFNTYGTGTGKTIPNGGPSTKALQDPAFRDALGYAVDHKALIDKVLGGFGDPGDMNVPPALAQWHVAPDKPRTFDIEKAKSLLDAAGYKLDGSGNRLDKDNKPISLRMLFPSTQDTYAKSAAFVADWYGQLGIKVSTTALDEDTLTQILLPPEAGDPKKDLAKYDIELWGWAGSPDPNALLQIFRCDAIGGTSDSLYCNPAYDALYDQQLKLAGDARKAVLAQMQNMIYNEAPYDILYYDANLAAYRTDKFAGWQNQPPDGTPFFTYSTLQYTYLTDATAAPSAAPSSASSGQPVVAGASSGPAASAATAPSGTATSSGSNTTLIVIVALAVVVLVGGFLLASRRRRNAVEDE
ncbi:MAG TPA: peptide ABC transporter substrate-binding protein [Candidatus Limnocylindrales bacterium]|nr:peptide ABC transporter substrate-binding protein [Candidatus Limnocylindrales bacterium]